MSNRVGSLLVASLLAAAPIAAQDIELSAISAGMGGVVITPRTAGDAYANNMTSAGDVNGDGIDDLVFAFPNETTTPPSQAEGIIYVVFGQNPPVTQSLADVFNGTGGFAIKGEPSAPMGDPGDFAGSSVSALGDVNGDGLADIGIGAPGYDIGGVNTSHGAAYVVFGKSTTSQVQLSAVRAGTGGFAINGEQFGADMGTELSAAGDVNGDGLADVITAAPVYSVFTGGAQPQFRQVGRAYVVFGKTGTGVVTLGPIADGAGGGFAIKGRNDDEYSVAGSSVSGGGDFNGDGISDLIVAAPLDSSSDPVDKARVYVVFGKSSPTPVELSAVALGNGGVMIESTAEATLMGESVSMAGDVNGDGLADVVIGSTDYPDPALADGPYASYGVGAVFVAFGKSGNTTPITTSQLLAGTGGFAVLGRLDTGGFYASGDEIGFKVSPTGDINGDGLMDIITSSQLTDAGPLVIFGRTATSTIFLSDFGGAGFRLLRETLNAPGASVAAAGDLNLDGLEDFCLTSRYRPNDNQDGWGYNIFAPYPAPVSTTYHTTARSGNAPVVGIGTHRYGTDLTVYANARVWVDFAGGTGPLPGLASTLSATVTRNDAGLTGFLPADTANVQWAVSSNRTVIGNARVSVKYTDTEIAGLNEANLVLYSAPTTAGPFTPVASFQHEPGRNRASGFVTTLPAVFVLSVVPPTGGAPLNGDADNDGDRDVADVTAIYNFLEGIATPLAGDGDVDNMGGVTTTDATLLIEHLVNGAAIP